MSVETLDLEALPKRATAEATWLDLFRQIDRKAAGVLITAAVVLTLHNYCRSPMGVSPMIGLLGQCGFAETAANIQSHLYAWEYNRMSRLEWWCGSCITNYFLLPWLVIRFSFGERLRSYGVKARGALMGLPIYLGMIAIMFPIVALMSGGERFQATYPFYKLMPGEAPGLGLCCWELLYACQFVSLEFFFRGFLVHGTRHAFGVNSVLVMMVPYCMIHFGKPMPETFAAIVAGLVLGLMSYRTRSIWLGAAVHIAVAWSMDAAVLLRHGWHG
jgi:membrane protease YdiL (CAAX protease family)